MTHSPACRAVSSLSGAVNSLRFETTRRRAFSSATWPTPSRMVRDTGLTLRRGPSYWGDLAVALGLRASDLCLDKAESTAHSLLKLAGRSSAARPFPGGGA